MKFLTPLVIFVLFAAPVAAYSIPGSNGFSFAVDIAGPEEINVSGTNAAYQGKGLATITIVASWTPDPVNGPGGFSVYDSYGHATFAFESGEGWGTATATVDMDAFNATYMDLFVTGTAYAGGIGMAPSSGFSTHILLYKHQVLVLPSGDEQQNIWTIGNSPINVNLWKIKLTPADTWYGATYILEAAAGETVTPTSSGFSFDPSSATIDDSGKATFSVIPNDTSAPGALSDPLAKTGAQANEWFPSPCTGTGMPTSSVEFGSGAGAKVTRKVIVPYARITSTSGDVRVKNALAGSWTTAASGCALGKGDIVFLGPMDAQTYANSYVAIEFYNLMTGEVDGSFMKEGTNLLIQLGDHIEIQEYTMMNNVRNLAFDVAANPREWAKSGITYGIGKGVEIATGGYGWVASKIGGALVTLGLRKMDEWNANPNLRYTPPAAASSKAKMDSRIAAALAPMMTTNANLYTVVNGDGTTTIVNRGETLLFTDGVTGGVIPTWGTASVDLDNASVSNGSPMYINPALGKPSINITPAQDAAVTTLQPKLVFDYPDAAWYPVMPQTFVARLNGYLVSQYMKPGATSTSWYPFRERPLVRGTNKITALIRTREGATSRGWSTFTASGALAAPAAPSIYAGKTTMVVRWDPVRDPDLAGYRVYRNGVEITTAVVTETIFADATAIAGTAYDYQVAAVDHGGQVSALSLAASATLNSHASSAAPDAVAALGATNGDSNVTLSFAAPARALAYLVERQEGAGAFANVLPDGGLVARSPFVDTTVANTKTYTYRITPLAFDLTPGTPTLSGTATPSDLPPAAPKWATASEDFNFAIVEWDPSPEADLAGYHVERAAPFGGFVRVTGTPIAETRYASTPPGGGVTGWRVFAVDTAGHESAPSNVAISNLPVIPTGDANGDGYVSSADLVWLINSLFGNGPPPTGSGDVNGDGKVNTADVMYLINYLFAGGPAPV